MKDSIVHIVYSGFGGTTDYIFNLIRGDEQNFYQHHIIFYGIEQTSKEHLDYAKSLCSSATLVLKEKGLDKRSIQHLKHAISEIQPKAVTLHVNSLIYSKRKWLDNRISLLFVEHQANHLKSKKEWIYSLLAQLRANYVLSLTQDYQKKLKSKLLFFYQPNKNLVINTGVVAEDFYQEKSNDIIKIGMIGRMNNFRDHATLLKAFQEIDSPKIELHFAGEGPLLNDLKKSVFKQNTFFHGVLNNLQIIKFISDLTIYVQASLGETSSLAIMQAQAAALPLVASNVSGINTSITEKNAILVPPQDVIAMKNAIEKLINDSELRAQLGENNRQFILANHRAEQMFKAYQKIIH